MTYLDLYENYEDDFYNDEDLHLQEEGEDSSMSDDDDDNYEESTSLQIIDVSIDSEYVSNPNVPAIPISLQICFTYKLEHRNPCTVALIIVSQRYSRHDLALKLKTYEKKHRDIFIRFGDLDNKNDLHVINSILAYFEAHNLLHLLPKNIHTQLFFFYSAQDLNIAFGRDNMYVYYIGKKKYIIQRRNLKGKLSWSVEKNNIEYNFFFYLKDLCGMVSGGLALLASSVGLAKSDALDNYKTQMDKALIEKSFLFIRYAVIDALLLPMIFDKKIESFNDIMSIYNIKPDMHFTRRTIPTTIGSIVYVIWLNYYKQVVFNGNTVFLLASFKQGVLNPLHKTYANNLKAFQHLRKFDSVKMLESYAQRFPSIYEQMYALLNQRNAFLYSITQYASINYLVSETPLGLGSILAYTTGGRTVNERPLEQVIENGADIDIQGAYGTVLLKTLYPIGRPRVLITSPNVNEKQKQKNSLGKVMDYLEKHVTTGLYKVSVNGKLSFKQDLIFSKIVADNYQKKQIDYTDEDADVTGLDSRYILLRNEIIHGFITKPLWDLIKKVATTQEYKELRDLTVEAAIYWLDSDRVNTIDELADEFLKDKGDLIFNQKQNSINDTRTQKWYGTSLNNFIGPLMKRRMELKKKKDSVSQAKQNADKSVVNTTWGLLTSRFFSINNVVCSEYVTSTIRCNLWLMIKALNLNISITDGGPYSLTNVSFLKKNKKRKPFKFITYLLSNFNFFKI